METTRNWLLPVLLAAGQGALMWLAPGPAPGPKDARPEDLLDAIRVAAAGDGIIAPAVTRRLIRAFAESAPRVPPATGDLGRLTPREREVLLRIAAGLTNAEIGADLGVTTGTVKTHVNGLLSKLGLRDRVQATILAYESGLVRPGAP
ncbi:LuxR C-terminal-related transcriptional regulator [Streptomyces collinus]